MKSKFAGKSWKGGGGGIVRAGKVGGGGWGMVRAGI